MVGSSCSWRESVGDECRNVTALQYGHADGAMTKPHGRNDGVQPSMLPTSGRQAVQVQMQGR